MTEQAAPQLLTADDVAARLKVSAWWVRAKTKPTLDADGNVIAPPVVSPMRLSSARNAVLRFTEADVLTLQAALRAPGSVVVPLPSGRARRTRQKRRTT